MILLKFLLIIFSLVVYFIKVLEYTYRYQLKEYRFDRMRSFMDEAGWLKTMYRFDFVLPAKKMRNAAILGSLFVVSLIYSVLIYRYSGFLILALTLLAPVCAFIDVTAMVWLTSFPVTLYREWRIRQAARKVIASKAIFIVVTGSYGKTSVKEYLYELLKTKYHVAKTEMNMNTDIGVALAVLKNLKKNTEYFIAEVGAYRTGEIAKICQFIKPSIVIITAFGNQHIDLYGSKKALVQAESEPLTFLNEQGRAYISKDIPEYEELVRRARFQVRTLSTRNAADYRAQKIHVSADGVDAEIKTPDDVFTIQSQLLGQHIITNLLPAIACAMDLGVSKSRIRITVKEMEPIPDKLSVGHSARGAVVISDASNSNVEGFIEAIHVVALFPQKHKYIASKGIIELGEEKESSYRKIIEALLETDIVLLTTDPLFAQLSKQQVEVFENEGFLKDHLDEKLDKGSLLLIEGRFTKAFTQHFTR